MNANDEDALFEADVLRVARALYVGDAPIFPGSSYLDNQERDMVFITDDVVVVIEATTSNRREKAQKDGAKLDRACRELQSKYPYRAVKGFFVTRDKPTTDQRQVIDKFPTPIQACSFNQFHSLLIKAEEYLACRNNYPFGSARDPETASHKLLEKYIPIDLIDDKGNVHSVSDLCENLSAGGRCVLLGDYGAGKSMTMRELYKGLEASYRQSSTFRFPVLLNLRDHQGQADPAEALARHARRMGFDQPSRLMRAFLAGDVHLLLDGFDEIATPGWVGRTDRLREVRFRGAELIRNFVELAPADSGLMISGRAHFFDGAAEMRRALGLRQLSIIVRANDYSDLQLQNYLRNKGWVAEIPEWFPARPLLVGYLVGRGLLGDVVGLNDGYAPAQGWDELLNKICERESYLNQSTGVSGPLVRQILERIATIARTTGDGLGPITSDHLRTAFREVCGYEPDEGSYVLLQRLPGLGVQGTLGEDDENLAAGASGPRYFVDEVVADALRAGDVVRFVKSQGQGLQEYWHGTPRVMDGLGVEVASMQLDNSNVAASQVLKSALQVQAKDGSDTYVVDLLRIAIEMTEGPQAIPALKVDGVIVPYLSAGIGLSSAGNVTFSDCIIQTLDMSDFESGSDIPYFNECVFGVVEGLASPAALPEGKFTQCDFEQFDARSRTNSGLLGIVKLSERQRVALTILKKLYIQRGSGRRESALSRGLNPAFKVHVGTALTAIKREGLAEQARIGKGTIYLPTRGSRERVRRILDAPTATADPLLGRLK